MIKNDSPQVKVSEGSDIATITNSSNSKIDKDRLAMSEILDNMLRRTSFSKQASSKQPSMIQKKVLQDIVTDDELAEYRNKILTKLNPVALKL